MATATRTADPQTRAHRAHGVAAVLAPLVGRFDARSADGRAFGLRFWDGSELPPTRAPAAGASPWLVLRSPDALRRISPRPASSA